MTIKFLTGDVRDVLATIPDGSVHLIASSPPFLALRSYLAADHTSKHIEIGSEANPAAFLDTLLALTAEWGRVLAPWGSLAIELGDTYSGSGGGGGDYLPGGLREGQPGFGGTAERQREGNAAHWRAKNATPDAWPQAKSLALIPQLYAVALAYGINPLTGQPSPAGRWRVRNVIVWHRPNPAVGALGDKFRPSTSYITVATRSKDRWFDLTAVRGVSAYIDDARHLRPDHKMNGRDVGLRNSGPNPAGAPPLDTWFDVYDTELASGFGEWDGHDTWNLTTQPSRLAHYAMWPAKLAERLILSMCPHEVCSVCGTARRRVEVTTNAVGKRPPVSVTAKKKYLSDALVHIDLNGGPDCSERETLGWTDCGHDAYVPGVVLDPFAGTGTTLCTAELHGRDSIGIDLNPANRALLEPRMAEVKRALHGTQPEMAGQMEMAL